MTEARPVDMKAITTDLRMLRSEVALHNYLYYVKAEPTISDREYDRLYQELVDIEREHSDLVTPDSPTQYVGYRKGDEG